VNCVAELGFRCRCTLRANMARLEFVLTTRLRIEKLWP